MSACCAEKNSSFVISTACAQGLLLILVYPCSGPREWGPFLLLFGLRRSPASGDTALFMPSPAFSSLMPDHAVPVRVGVKTGQRVRNGGLDRLCPLSVYLLSVSCHGTGSCPGPVSALIRAQTIGQPAVKPVRMKQSFLSAYLLTTFVSSSRLSGSKPASIRGRFRQTRKEELFFFSLPRAMQDQDPRKKGS